MDTATASMVERIRALPEAEREAELKKMPLGMLAACRYDWLCFARDKQKPPELNPKIKRMDWMTWMVRAGRGFGKTRTGSGWVHMRALEQAGRSIALVARTPADARDYMIIGPGGILRNTAPEERPKYESSNRALIWPNGSRATIYSDEVPDQLRGFSGDTAWIDELAKYKHPQETWDNLNFGMRELTEDTSGPRILITTTPRPIKLLREIEALTSTVVVTGSSYENKSNLSPKWFADVLGRYAGTRLGRQEIEAQIIDDLPGALWTRDVLEENRLKRDPERVAPPGLDVLEKLRYEYRLPQFKRVVVGVDPSGTGDGESGNSIGIVVAGLGVDDIAYVLTDMTATGMGPAAWARRVIQAKDAYQADLIVAEKNFGGAMVESTIRTADRTAPIKIVWASRGKVVRAEPVAALYDQGKVRHVGGFPEMEDQMCAFLPEGYAEEGSPDRADALVWALSNLMLRKRWDEPRMETGLPVVG